jgi:mono/diheme cytochrome c family protein
MRYSLFLVIVLAVVWSSVAASANSSVFGNVPKGKVYFSKRCAMCHGLDGRGNRGMAPDFSVEWDRLTKSDDVLAANIRAEYKDPTSEILYGAGECPSHPAIIDDDMDDILAFLRRMAERTQHGGRLDEADNFFDKEFDDFDKEENDFDKKFDEFDRDEDEFEKRFRDFDR